MTRGPVVTPEPESDTSYKPKSKDGKGFWDKHKVEKIADRNGNGDDVFQATNIKAYNRGASNHGYDTSADAKVYEETGKKTLSQFLGEKKLTSAEMDKREEVAKAIERDNPGMPMDKKMAIATATAKKVAEEVEELAELSRKTLTSYVEKVAKTKGAKAGSYDTGLKTAAKKIADKKKMAAEDFDIFGDHSDAMQTIYNVLSEENQDYFDQLFANEQYQELLDIASEILFVEDEEHA